MTRFRYDDPLSMIWMQQRYGMRFVDAEGTEVANILGSSPLYIHPESLHIILEPQSGDVWVTDHGMGRVVGPASAKVFREKLIRQDAKIVVRNGMPFHYPEMERAS